MHSWTRIALILVALPVAARAQERLGTVVFPISCSAAVQKPFNRGVALLHDFWYEEAERQFGDIAQSDPGCAMAHWGRAMSKFHQIWNRPNEAVMAQGRAEMQAAAAHAPKTGRERAYIAALSQFYAPGDKEYAVRVGSYSRAMADLHGRYPSDVDAAAFYALSLLAAAPPGDTSLAAERRAAEILRPLFVKFPDNPGVVHYLIHACDTPALAPAGLAAAQHYGQIAASGAHAAHMPGHIFARLGMWRDDIDANLASSAAAEAARSVHAGEDFDEFHANEFLLYAYLQSGQEASARQMLDDTATLLAHMDTMPDMASSPMTGMFGYYRAEFPAFYDLETRDWKAAATLPVDTKAEPNVQLMTLWARIIAQGRLRDAQAAHADLAHYQTLVAELKNGANGYMAASTWLRVMNDETLGWVAYADAQPAAALEHLRRSAALQDTVGQGEVDIPAREMLADMLLELHQPAAALREYEQALKLSPNRFNGLYNAGLASEAAGDRDGASRYYAALLTSTDNGAHSGRAELQHAKEFTATFAAAASMR
jgi:tetratricopeptide (TPR) repeat protein